MPGTVLTQPSPVICAHAGQAVATTPFLRVTIVGAPVVTIATLYSIAGCALAAAGSPPCVTGQWIVGATRVTAGGAPVAVPTGTSLATPTGTPLTPLGGQTRVVAT